MPNLAQVVFTIRAVISETLFLWSTMYWGNYQNQISDPEAPSDTLINVIYGDSVRSQNSYYVRAIVHMNAEKRLKNTGIDPVKYYQEVSYLQWLRKFWNGAFVRKVGGIFNRLEKESKIILSISAKGR